MFYHTIAIAPVTMTYIDFINLGIGCEHVENLPYGFIKWHTLTTNNITITKLVDTTKDLCEVN